MRRAFASLLLCALASQATTSEIIITGQERDPLQREMRLSFSVAPAVARGPRTWTVVLMLCLSLLLLFPQCRHLSRYARRFWR